MTTIEGEGKVGSKIERMYVSAESISRELV